jgi:hypothetical protein
VLVAVFTPELVDRVVEQAGVREQRTRTLPARVVVYYLLAMVLFFNSSYTEVWNKLVAGLDWARRFRVRLELGMQPTAAAVTYARQRLGWQVMAALLEEVAGPLAGEEQERAFAAGMRLVAVDGMCLDLPDTPENGAEFGYPGNGGHRGWRGSAIPARSSTFPPAASHTSAIALINEIFIDRNALAAPLVSSQVAGSVMISGTPASVIGL